MASQFPSHSGLPKTCADAKVRRKTIYSDQPFTLTTLLFVTFCVLVYSSSAFPHFAPSHISTQNQSELEAGKPLDREMVGGQVHHYQLRLLSGMYLRIVIEQKGTGVLMALFDPDGNKLVEADGSLALQVPLHAVTETTGIYRLEVRSVAKEGASLGYKVSLDQLREATKEDRQRVVALGAEWEGTRLRAQATTESFRLSIEIFQQALAIYKNLNDHKAEANTLVALAYNYQELTEPSKALEAFHQALALYRALKDRSKETITLCRIGEVNLELGEYRKALEFYGQALLLIGEGSDHSLQAPTLKAMAQAHYSLGEQAQAVESYDQALLRYREQNDRRGEADTLFGLGRVYGAMDEGQKALEVYHRAKELYQALEDTGGEAQTLTGIGQVYASFSESQKALEFYQRALPLLRATDNRHSEALTLFYIGEAHYNLNEYQAALENYNQVLEFYRSVKSRAGEAVTLNSLGQVYAALGDPEKALDIYHQSLAIYQATNNPLGQASLLNNIAAVYLSVEEYRQALASLGQALPLIRKVGNRRREASMLNNIGSAHTALGEYQQALGFYSQALALNREIGNRRSEASVLNNTGRTYLALRDDDKAFAYLNEALALNRAISDRKQEAQTLYHLARIHRARGNFSEALASSDAAIKIAETLRQQVAEPLLRASHFASLQQFYELNIDVLMQLHKARPSAGFQAAALEASERRRARSLLDLLAEARADIRQGIDPLLAGRERSLGKLLDAKAERQTQLLSGKAAPEQLAKTAAEVESIITEYRQVQAQIRAASPRYAALTQPQPIALRDIQEQLLDADTLLLEYALGDERSYLWAVSADAITSYELPKREEIEAAARGFYELAKSDGEKAKLEVAAATLSHILLSPVADRLASKRLLIVADGALQYIPFAALPKPQTRRQRERGGEKEKGRGGERDAVATRVNSVPLILEHEIVMLPSASVLAQMRRETVGRKVAPQALAVFADPVFSRDDLRLKASGKPAATSAATGAALVRNDWQRALADVGLTGNSEGFPRLPFSRREAEAIAAWVPQGEAMKALDFLASRDTLNNTELSRYRILHFATHGLLNNRHPELSGIVLSLYDSKGEPQNGFLRLHDIFNLKLPVELVVLSACQTGMGKQIRGEGLIGLTRGFMYAGVPRVVASLWKVDDAATAELMKRFYKEMLGSGLRPAAALRTAQMEMWKQPRWRSPYFWAAFVLQGEWQ